MLILIPVVVAGDGLVVVVVVMLVLVIGRLGFRNLHVTSLMVPTTMINYSYKEKMTSMITRLRTKTVNRYDICVD